MLHEVDREICVLLEEIKQMTSCATPQVATIEQ